MLLFIFLSSFCPILALDDKTGHLPKIIERPRVALVLGGGGCRGAAHIGVLRVLEKEQIPIDLVVGNSIGAIVGGLYCANVPLSRIEEILKDQTMSKVYLPRFIWARILLIPLRPIIYAFREKPAAGLASTKKMSNFLQKQLPNNRRMIEQLPIPFKSVSLNLVDGNVKTFDEGDLVQAMTASSTIPGLFKPAKIGSAYCVDGGIGANLPTFKARQSGAQIVIAVSVDNGIQIAPTAKLSSYRFLGRRLLDVAFISMDKRLREEADIVIAPKLFGARMLDDDVQRINDSVEAGEIAARSAMPDIRKALDLQAQPAP